MGHRKSECKHAKRVNVVGEEVQDKEDVVECGRIRVVGHIDVRANHNDDENEFPNVAKPQARGSLLGGSKATVGCLGSRLSWNMSFAKELETRNTAAWERVAHDG